MIDLTPLSPSAIAMLAFLGTVVGLFLSVFVLDAFLVKGAARLPWWDLWSRIARLFVRKQ
jgi:hypothetical protein